MILLFFVLQLGRYRQSFIATLLKKGEPWYVLTKGNAWNKINLYVQTVYNRLYGCKDGRCARFSAATMQHDSRRKKNIMSECTHDCSTCSSDCGQAPQTAAPEGCTHDCSTCTQNCDSRETSPADFRKKPHEMSSIKKVIGVISGKGGVGKSLVTSMLAVEMNRLGYHSRRRHHGPLHPQGLRPDRKGAGHRVWPLARPQQVWHRHHVGQSAAAR